MMNRRGQVAFLMMFLVAIVLVVSSFYVFTSFSGGFKGKALESSRMLSNIEFGEEYVESTAKVVAKEVISAGSSDLKDKFIYMTDKKDLQVYEAGNYFGKIVAEKDFDFFESGGEYKLEIRGLFVQAEVGNNRMRGNFDLCMVFNSDGSYRESCKIGSITNNIA